MEESGHGDVSDRRVGASSGLRPSCVGVGLAVEEVYERTATPGRGRVGGMG